MRYFLDTEFIEDGKTIDLISLGVVAEDGRELYAISEEAELHRANEWVRKNVLPKLPPYGHSWWLPRKLIADQFRRFVAVKCDPMSGELNFPPGWTADPAPEFWGYYSDYDWVAVCQLFGTMVDLPEHFPMFCRDLKQLSVDLGSPQHPPNVDEHNALGDARWNRDLYNFLTRVRAERAESRVGYGG